MHVAGLNGWGFSTEGQVTRRPVAKRRVSLRPNQVIQPEKGPILRFGKKIPRKNIVTSSLVGGTGLIMSLVGGWMDSHPTVFQHNKTHKAISAAFQPVKSSWDWQSTLSEKNVLEEAYRRRMQTLATHYIEDALKAVSNHSEEDFLAQQFAQFPDLNEQDAKEVASILEKHRTKYNFVNHNTLLQEVTDKVLSRHYDHELLVEAQVNVNQVLEKIDKERFGEDLGGPVLMLMGVLLIVGAFDLLDKKQGAKTSEKTDRNSESKGQSFSDPAPEAAVEEQQT